MVDSEAGPGGRRVGRVGANLKIMIDAAVASHEPDRNWQDDILV